MAQFDLHTILNQMFLTLFGFYMFHLIITKFLLVQLKRQEYIIYYVSKHKAHTYEWLKIDAFSLDVPEKRDKILSFFKHFKKI